MFVAHFNIFWQYTKLIMCESIAKKKVKKRILIRLN
jgi:hypothetical protein